MTDSLTFSRIGAAPGREPELAPWPWNPQDRILTDGMKPLGTKFRDEGGITTGMWACDAGGVEIGEHPVDEACFVIRGAASVTDAAGRRETFGPGEAFMLPRGFRGRWEQSDDFVKLFVAISR